MIKVWGKGHRQHLFDLLGHHAGGVAHLIAPIAVVLIGVLGRANDEHEIHIGSGWNSVNLCLANGERLALRARTTANIYDHLVVFRGSINPLGPKALEVRSPRDVARFHCELKIGRKPARSARIRAPASG